MDAGLENNGVLMMQSRKRIFLGLLLLFSLLLLLVPLYFLFSLQGPDETLMRLILSGLAIILGVIAAISLLALGVTLISLLRGSPLSGFSRLVEKTLVFFYPFVVQLGRLLHITQESIQRSFIEVNNRLIELKGLKVVPDKLLILLPHCLQNDDCPHKITRDPENCRRCGRCQIGKLVKMSEQWQTRIQVVTGGTLARKAVKSHHPDLILAVACERDLSSGIVDCFPLPVFGILNDRPEGPCYNTLVALEKLEEKLSVIVGKPVKTN